MSMPFGSQNLHMHDSKFYRVSKKMEFFPSVLNGLFYLKNFNQLNCKGTHAVCAVTLVLSLCNAMNCSPPGSSVHGILQERILEWVAMTSSRGSSRTRNRTRVACLLRWQVGSLPLAQPGKSKLRRKTRQVSRLIS